MNANRIAASTALAVVLAAGSAYAQQARQTQGTQGTRTGTGTGTNVSSQRITQEQARYRGTEIYISPAGTRQIQQALNQKGYNVGAVNGVWGKGSARAAANFMQAQGLAPSGSVTVSLVRSLGLGNLLGGGAGAGTQGAGQSTNQRIAQESAAQNGGAPLTISPAGVRVVQQALNQMGYNVGGVTGRWTQQTSQAAANFEQARGLEPVGLLDVSLIQTLGIGNQVYAGGNAGSRTGAGGVSGGATAAGGASQGNAAGRTAPSNRRGAAGGTAAGGQSGSSNQRLSQEKAISGTQLYLSPAGVRVLAQALNQAGYSAGPVSGQWSKQARQAVLNYQQAHGLEPTGRLTTAFLSAIGLNTWLPGAGTGRSTARTGGSGLQQTNGVGNGVGAQAGAGNLGNAGARTGLAQGSRAGTAQGVQGVQNGQGVGQAAAAGKAGGTTRARGTASRNAGRQAGNGAAAGGTLTGSTNANGQAGGASTGANGQAGVATSGAGGTAGTVRILPNGGQGTTSGQTGSASAATR
ncbi:peptidoglycan-binding protein [Jiella sp. M17.18]|uniref:peptidoglycan-binding domain-containing protein n=1 Tax=Jiella sp. M17.18 TaxID=3234247 RepID=UPI0034DF1E75